MAKHGRLILHIGDCKTGSTVLQTMLARGDATVSTQRLFSPGRGSHGGLARSLSDRPALYPVRWEKMATRLNEAEWDIAVLSSELFEFAHPAKVAEAVRTHFAPYWEDLTVIAYLRPHAARVLSQGAENFKLGFATGSFEDYVTHFIDIKRLAYSARLARWKDTFGDRLVVRLFVRDHMVKGDVRHDFMSVIAPEGGYEITDSGQDSNAALTLGDLALMRMMQRMLATADPQIAMDNRVAFGKAFGRLLRDIPSPLQGAGRERLRLTRALYDQVVAASADDAAKVDREWFNDPERPAVLTTALAKAEQDITETAQSLEAEDHFDPETLRLMRAWTELLIRQMYDGPEATRKRLGSELL